jgi:hypothetical protein
MEVVTGSDACGSSTDDGHLHAGRRRRLWQEENNNNNSVCMANGEFDCAE